jgi:hypothetical protein
MMPSCRPKCYDGKEDTKNGYAEIPVMTRFFSTDF